MRDDDLFSMDTGELDFDEELGIAPLVAAAAPMVMGMAQKLLGGIMGGKKEAPAASASGSADLSALIPLISNIPQLVRDQITDAMQLAQAAKATVNEAQAKIVGSVDAQFAPQINTILSTLRNNQLQTEATQEHRAIVAADAQKALVNESLANLQKQMGRMNAHLNARVRIKPGIIDILGGKDFLDSIGR